MKLLDRYILKQFLSTFFFVVLILLSVISVIDLTEKMDKFAKFNLPASAIAGYYLDFIPWIGSLITPITIFIATVYVCARLAGRTEVVAILSAGVSFRRYLLPFFLGAALVATLSFVFNGWLIPNSNKSKLAFEMQYLKNRFYFDKRNIHLQVAPDVYLYMQSYNNTNNVGYQFSIERFEDNRLIEKLTASRIEWDTTKQKWTIRDYRIRHIDSVFNQGPDGDSLSVSPIAKTSLGSREISYSGNSLDTALVIHPKEFENDYRKYDGMTINELRDYITTLRARGSSGVEAYEVELNTRYAAPFSIFILVFMGAIVASRKSRGGTGVQIALGFSLSFIFIIFFTLFKTFAEAGSMPPEISVWIPNVIFGVISLVMYKYVPR